MNHFALPCRREAAALASARRGRVDGELAAHIAGCATCAVAAAAGAALRQASISFAAEARVPDSLDLLRRAGEERHRVATARVLLPLRLARIAAFATAAGAAAVLLPKLFSQVQWNAVAPLRTLLPTAGPSWIANCALLLALIVGALWLHWEEA